MGAICSLSFRHLVRSLLFYSDRLSFLCINIAIDFIYTNNRSFQPERRNYNFFSHHFASVYAAENLLVYRFKRSEYHSHWNRNGSYYEFIHAFGGEDTSKHAERAGD